MIAVALVIYFAIAVLLAAIVLLPPVRLTILGGIAVWHARFMRRASNNALKAKAQLSYSAKMSQATIADMQNLLARRRLLILTTTGILATPPLVAVALRGKQLFQFDDVSRSPDEKIAQLLNGEQLVPPPPLPPPPMRKPLPVLPRSPNSSPCCNWSPTPRRRPMSRS